MAKQADIDQVAELLLGSVSLIVRRLRQTKVEGELSTPEHSALSRLQRGGPATSAELARIQQVSPQSMGATLAALESAGLVERSRDPEDGRRVVMSATEAGVQRVLHKRSARADQLAAALSDGFSDAELQQLKDAVPLIERLAQNL